ncbi:hypothetical protein [Nocardiopsis quinghaiensis]|uniref:hypothetical protein n=1 Tax=Nocardiopsis quinghaiensis TaxID=464995 RepID=UPI00123C56C3|nr:hypothetical protein [Nocardiopsis quinghaiensis]
MDTLTTVVIPLAAMAVAGISASAAWAAARAAHRSAHSAATLATNDAERRRDELAPTIDLACQAQGQRRAVLTLTLTGPTGLEGLDRVEVTIADPLPDRYPVIAGGPTQQELDAQVWGPYRFVTSTTGVTGHGTAQVEHVRPHTPVDLALEQTPAPAWVADPAGWQEERAGQLLITLVCHHARYRPWTLERQTVATH